MASTSALLPSLMPRMVETNRRRRRTNLTITSAKRREIHDQNFGGRNIVDENMIVLRKRIREMGMVERDDEPPAGWMDWEKDIYPSYDMIICDAMRFLQWYLMETRPCFALGIIGLIALSVPISTAVVVLNLLELSRGVLSAVHLC
ncbi:uncharacterized protein LOC142556597 [Primulina tabacum]|uniref:uncharacterized protein LOC142556597 n=1 Tax=Primulina tabacum TaxID=48773 RepID=UPI003F5A977A